MKTRRFGLIGSGWRAEFYIRISKLMPEQFQLTSVMIRDPEKGKAFSERFDVAVVNTLDDLLAGNPEFVVVCIKRGFVTDMIIELANRNVPVLAETPPGESDSDLLRLWNAVGHAKIQVAEQYFVQPLYSAWHTAITSGMLGDVENIDLSALHGYHGISIIRRYLDVGMEPCRIYGKRHFFRVTETFGRDGMNFDGETFLCPRDRLTLEFENGKVAFFDFSDPAQYHSFIRTRHIAVQGTRGEISDTTIRYLTEENIPVTENLNRIDLGVYNNQGWSHFAIMLGQRFLYRSPYPNARLNDDEIAVASCLEGMSHYLDTGIVFYSLQDALQDTYLSLRMEEALENPLQIIHSKKMPWC